MNSTKQLKLDTITNFPKKGELVKGKILELKKNEIYVDIDGYFLGLIRGVEITDESNRYSDLKVGDEIVATVIDQENEKGLVELSLKIAGHQTAWQRIKEIEEKKETIEVTVLKANKGGLIVSYDKISGFLPVSRLLPSHYPKVKNGDKNKILEKLQKLIGKKLRVKISSLDIDKEMIIFSEKEAEQNSSKTNGQKEEDLIGKIVEAKITGLTDFGVFVNFDGHEGLIHVSEMSWQRIDDISDIVKVNDIVKAKVIGLFKNKKFSLSLKQLMENPWEKIDKIYHVGDIVEATVTKITPFGIFAKIKEGIQGLVHISEISDSEKQIKPEEIVKIGQTLKLKIISLEPENQRLGFSLKF